MKKIILVAVVAALSTSCFAADPHRKPTFGDDATRMELRLQTQRVIDERNGSSQQKAVQVQQQSVPAMLVRSLLSNLMK